MKKFADFCVMQCCNVVQCLLGIDYAFREVPLKIVASSIFPGIQVCAIAYFNSGTDCQ